MKFINSISVFVTASLAISSCNVINPAESIPTYVQIDSIPMKDNPGNNYGSTSSKITDVWVYWNNNLLGAYPLPAKIPVIMKETGSLSVVPGVVVDGMSDKHSPYSFYKDAPFTLSPTPGKTQVLHPTTMYRDGLNLWKEDFEQGNSFVKLSGDTALYRTSESGKVFEGSFSGQIILDANHTVSECVTSSSLGLPYGKDVFIEIDYKCNVPFGLGLRTTKSGIDVSQYAITINPKENWNKLYISIGDDIGTLLTGVYKLLIYAKLPTGQTSGYVLVDNIKVVYLK